MIKTWDILRAPEDVWVRDVASLPAGIQSGSLSPDGMNLLVGDAVGGVHVLSAAPFGLLHTDLNDHADDIGYNPDPITFVYADANKDESDLDNPGTEGIELAKQYMESGQTVLHPLFGVGKGPNYQSPLALYARWDNLVSGYSELVPDFDQRQAFSIDGVEQPEFSGKIKTLVAARKEQMLAAKQGLKALMFALGDPTLFVANRSASNKPATQTFGTEIPSSSRNCTLSTNTTKPSSSELKASCPLALASTTPTTFSPPRPRTPETIDFTDNRPTSPITGNKRRRPSTPSIVQPSTPTNASKRIKLEYESPLKHPKKSPNSIRTTGIEIVDLTDDTIFERANAFYQSLQGNYDVNSSSASAKKGEHGRIALKGDKVVIDLSEEDENESVEENLLTWEEWVEEDHWWPTMF
ncbi:MAG: hypothetical protein L6R41_007429 [Letrouitia leprolyta]|nr:MAG: hypothetical protein L6R41_007429 [Letrouitia leprolyta]